MMPIRSFVSQVFATAFPASVRRQRLRQRGAATTEQLEQRQLLVGDIGGQIWVDTIATGAMMPVNAVWPAGLCSSIPAVMGC